MLDSCFHVLWELPAIACKMHDMSVDKVWTLAGEYLISKCPGLSAALCFPGTLEQSWSHLRTRAGPREFLHFDPHDPASAAAIISCGGICPGLNCALDLVSYDAFKLLVAA